MNKKFFQTLILTGIATLGTSYAYVMYTLTQEHMLPKNDIVFKVYSDENLSSVSRRLEEEDIITSSRILRLYLSWKQVDTKLSQGEFHFISPISIKDVGNQLIQKPTKPLVVVTIPEGSDDSEVADLFIKKNSSLKKDVLLSEIKRRGASGYLFPDTYFLSGREGEDELVEKALVNFRNKYNEKFLEEKASIGDLLNNNEVRRHLVIASVLEGEANTEYDMRMIADILLRRESMGMRLQVDAAKETYTRKGFPEDPINNPGLLSLRAAKNPLKNDFLYYITGKDGKMHYAKTFTEHRKNIALYLK